MAAILSRGRWFKLPPAADIEDVITSEQLNGLIAMKWNISWLNARRQIWPWIVGICYISAKKKKNGPKKWKMNILIEHWASNVAIISLVMTLTFCRSCRQQVMRQEWADWLPQNKKRIHLLNARHQMGAGYNQYLPGWLQWPLLLTWINMDPSMDKKLHAQ